jgi:hypothetical protein
MAPPPPVEDVDAEFIAPTMRQLAARRARRGAYITGAERKLGGKPRVSGKEASAIADKTVRELDPMKGFTAPTRRQASGTGRGRTEGEKKEDFDLRKSQAEAEFIQEQASLAGSSDLKTIEEFDPERTATIEKAEKKGGRAKAVQSYQKAVADRKRNYTKYLQDYVDQSTGRLKRGYRTTQLRNLGLM